MSLWAKGIHVEPRVERVLRSVAHLVWSGCIDVDAVEEMILFAFGCMHLTHEVDSLSIEVGILLAPLDACSHLLATEPV
jgi:hypothetical protein